MTEPALQRTGLNFKRRCIVDQMKVAVMEDVLVVAVIKAMETMKGTNLEWQTLPMLLPVELTVLMEFG